MKMFSGTARVIALLLVGLAVGFLIGRSAGFETGSEWALLQANIVARESGLFMPVYLDNGKFRVVVKQPRNLYKKAWQRADQYDQAGALKTEKFLETHETGPSGSQTDF